MKLRDWNDANDRGLDDDDVRSIVIDMVIGSTFEVVEISGGPTDTCHYNLVWKYGGTVLANVRLGNDGFNDGGNDGTRFKAGRMMKSEKEI